MQNNIKELATEPVGKLLWRYSLPAVIGMMVMALYNCVDRIFIGQGVGPEAISGLAVTFPVMNLSAALGVLIGGGAAARTSILLGARDFEGAERVLGNSLLLTLVIGTIYISLFGIFVDDILLAFGATAVTLPYARDFMLWIIPGMIVINITFSFNNIMRASGYPVRAMVTMMIGAVCNAILAPIFIFWLDLGIKGAAIATDISMVISAIFVMSHFISKKSTIHFRKGIYGLRWRIVWAIVSIGAAPSLVNAASCFVTMQLNQSLLRYGGDIDVGAAGIFITYSSLLVTFVVGLGLGMQPIVGYNYGAGLLGRLKKVYVLATVVATGVCTLGCVVGITFPKYIAMVFTTDAHLIDVTANGLKIAMVAFWVVGFQIISTGFFQSIGKAGKSIFLSLVRQVIFLLPLLLILPGYYRLDGVWVAFPVSDAMATICTIILIIIQFRQIYNDEHKRNQDPIRH
ncbi:MAG: MATE family efflux transporter [Clostridium sp.]|nr:MATE family efflux transporter [Clostridium sp.]